MKYINSDMLRHLFEVWKEIEEKAGNNKGAYCYNECINAIDKMPSDNVVEIVRCKDCKNRKTLPNWIHGQSIDTYYCKRFCDSDIGKVELNDFCSYGERGETNG